MNTVCAGRDGGARSFGEGNLAWFLDGEINVCYNCVDRHALVAPDRVRRVRRWRERRTPPVHADALDAGRASHGTHVRS